jgi:hypothetical protein
MLPLKNDAPATPRGGQALVNSTFELTVAYKKIPLAQKRSRQEQPGSISFRICTGNLFFR